MKYSHLLLLLTLGFSVSAHAARGLPADAHTGVLKALDYPMVKIGGDTLRVAPGARIYSPDNLVIMHNQMPAEAKVLYKHDSSGFIMNVWLLSEEEIQTLKKAGKKF
jgi:hypothetical protein